MLRLLHHRGYWELDCCKPFFHGRHLRRALTALEYYTLPGGNGRFRPSWNTCRVYAHPLHAYILRSISKYEIYTKRESTVYFEHQSVATSHALRCSCVPTANAGGSRPMVERRTKKLHALPYTKKLHFTLLKRNEHKVLCCTSPINYQ